MHPITWHINVRHITGFTGSLFFSKFQYLLYIITATGDLGEKRLPTLSANITKAPQHM